LKDESDTGLLVAAAQYLEANGDRDSAQVLENAFKRRTDDPDVSKACLIAVARLQPRSPVVQKYLDDLVAGRSEKLKLLEAPTLAAEFLKDTPLFERPEDARDLVFEHCLRESGALAMAGGGARPTPAARIHLHAAVIMPDHVHLLLTPLRGQNGWPFPLVGILQCLKGVTAHRINKLLHISGPVWEEESFDHVLRSEESLKEKAQYIQQNPVEAGLVRAPEDYRWLWISPDLKL
jgi:REP element-mobilizing transposase RayT